MGNWAKNVLVTGGAGFIGSELTHQLVRRGAFVTVTDNLVNGKRENLDDLPDDSYKLEVLDIRDTEKMKPLLRDISIVYHLACLGVRHSIHSPFENHDVNATGTLKLLSLARDEGIGRFVYVSSSEVYGTAHSVPMDEEHPTFPMTVYGSAKLAGDSYTRSFYLTYGYPTVVIRPFNTYGPRCHHEGDSGEVIPKFLLRALTGKPMIIFGDGSQTRDFTYVQDTARGILEAGFAESVIGETINLGNSRETSIRELAEAVRSVTNRPEAPISMEAARPGDVARHYSDTNKARRLLGYSPGTNLMKGLEHLMQWYLQRGSSLDKLLSEERVQNWTAPSIKGGMR